MNLKQYFCSIEQIHTMSASIILYDYSIPEPGAFEAHIPITLWPYKGLEILLYYRSYSVGNWVQGRWYGIVNTDTFDMIYSVVLR